MQMLNSTVSKRAIFGQKTDFSMLFGQKSDLACRLAKSGTNGCTMFESCKSGTVPDVPGQYVDGISWTG